MRTLIRGVTVIFAAGLAACLQKPGAPTVTTSPSPATASAFPAAVSPAPASPLPGGFVAVTADDPRLRTAVDKAVPQLRGTDWLAAPDLAAGAITAGERQVVAGTNHRATLTLLDGGKSRPARITVFEDLEGRFRATAVDLGPVGSTAPLPDVPATAAMPGGWSEQPPGDPGVAATAERARGLLAGGEWLRRPVTVERVLIARTQVVAGLNTYLAIDVRVDGFAHRVDAIVYEPLEGPATLTWVRITDPGRGVEGG